MRLERTTASQTKDEIQAIRSKLRSSISIDKGRETRLSWMSH